MGVSCSGNVFCKFIVIRFFHVNIRYIGGIGGVN